MPTKIILLIIAFQVVMGILAKRKARKGAEAAARNPGTGPGDRSAAGESAHAAPARRPEAIQGGRGSYDEYADAEEDGDDWEEHPLRSSRPLPTLPQAGPEAAGRAPRSPADGSAGSAAGSRGKAAELGKDLLSQLARELGLEIPPSPQRKPAPGPRPAQPAPKAPAAGIPAPAAPPAPRKTLAERLDAAKRTSTAHASRPHYRDGGESAPRRASSNVPVTEEPMIRSVSDLARESLADAESIRRAFILKTILDKPLSLQPRFPGGN
ncbi:MAG TPA: hypothetical protein VJ385_12075 [Fibrobacteria bacterium]|nr:hypothetical protein [Fibrobacteria bacterium]